MEKGKGKKGLELTWQNDFPETTKCGCGGEARIAFVVQETEEENWVCNLHDNKPGSMWPHDAIAVAVKKKKKCLEPAALFNQA